MADPKAKPTAVRKPDAILCPRNFGVKPGHDRHQTYKTLFAGVFGSRKVWAGDLLHQASQVLLTPKAGPDTSPDFPHGHPMHGEGRYEWWVGQQDPKTGVWSPIAPAEDAPGEDARVRLGYLKEDPYADNPDVQAAIQAELDRKHQELWQSPDTHKRLHALGVIDDDELSARLAALGIKPTSEAPDAPVATKPSQVASTPSSAPVNSTHDPL